MSDYRSYLVENGDLVRITIKAGYENDGASVPRCLWWFLRPDGVHRAACLIHDYLYENRGYLKEGTFSRYSMEDHGWTDMDYSTSRREADRLFRDMLLSYDVSPLRANLAWLAVRVFGGFYFR